MQCVQNFQSLAISSFAAAQWEVDHIQTYENVKWVTDRHFSRKTSGFLPQDSAHHHRWFTMEGIHAANSEQPDFFDAADSFLLTDLATCHESKVCRMLPWLTLISFFIWGCLSVEITATFMPSLFDFQRQEMYKYSIFHSGLVNHNDHHLPKRLYFLWTLKWRTLWPVLLPKWF